MLLFLHLKFLDFSSWSLFQRNSTLIQQSVLTFKLLSAEEVAGSDCLKCNVSKTVGFNCKCLSSHHPPITSASSQRTLLISLSWKKALRFRTSQSLNSCPLTLYALSTPIYTFGPIQKQLKFWVSIFKSRTDFSSNREESESTSDVKRWITSPRQIKFKL